MQHSCTLGRSSRCAIALLIGDAPITELHGGRAMNETVELVGEYVVPVDPMGDLECDSCR